MTTLITSYGKDFFFVDDSSTINVSIEESAKNVFINGVELDKTSVLSESDSIITYVVNSDIKQNNSYIYHIYIDTSTSFDASIGDYKLNYTPKKTSEEKYGSAQKLIGNQSSYELLRANPKLTGNVKVVVNSDSNLYLDTFKVSKGLSQRKYRKIPMNPDEYYGNILMSKMSGMPTEDFYKIEDSCYDLFSLANNLGEQYYDVYNSGVRTNHDRMYGENYSILAPLCIKKTMPDFFLIFKVKDYENISDSSERLKYFFSKGKIVKAFDLRKDSNVGKFIRNIYEHSRNYVGDIFISYDYDMDNIYNGISLDRGVVTKVHESTSLERKIKNQVAMNDWYTLGFERNRIVSKNIVNFEFMFDDLEEELFSINTYFGVYVKLNGEESDFSCTGFEDGVPVFDSESICNSSLFNPSEYSEIIYGLSTADDFIRLSKNICSSTNYDTLKEYKNKPYKNIASPYIIDMGIDTEDKSFISVTVNTLMDVGEHYRIVDSSAHKIYEVVLSNAKNENLEISEANHYDYTFTDENDTEKTYEIERVSIYNIAYRKDEIDKESIEDTRKEEIRLLTKAFNSFDESLIYAYGYDSHFSIIYTGSDDVNMEKICSFVNVDCDSSLNDEYSDDSAYFFNDASIGERKTLELSNEDEFYPHGFEVLGDRISYQCPFISFEENESGILYLIDRNIEYELSNEKTPVFYDENNEYTQIKKIKLFEIDNTSIEKWTIPGFGNNDNYFIRLPKEPFIDKGKIHFYNLYPINAGICSIFPVKDIVTDVIDNVNKISTKESDYISLDSGEFSENNNIFNEILLEGSEENIINYIDKEERVKINDILTKDNFSSYLTELISLNHLHSDISLMHLSCCKWKCVGTDTRGENMRVMYDCNTLNEENNSYFIPAENDAYVGLVTVSDGSTDCSLGEYNRLIFDCSTHGYPKYLNSHFDPRIYPTYKNFLFNGSGSIDDLLHNIGGGMAIPSVVYSVGNDSIEFICGGIKLRITSKNLSILDISKYNSYSAILICSSGNNPNSTNPCEILIDEKNEQISVIVYNGSAPWQMTYNQYNAKRTKNGKPYLPMVYPVFHKQSMNELSTYYISNENYVKIHDDSNSMKHDCSLYYNESGVGFVLSPIVDNESFIREKNMLLAGKINEDSFDKSNESLLLSDSSLYIDSSYYRPTTSRFYANLNETNDSVDMFILSHLPDDENSTFESKDTDYATLPIEMIKPFFSNASLTIKKEHDILNYSSINDLFEIKIIDPINLIRENNEFKKINENAPLKVHPCYVEPLTKNIISFDYSNDSVNEEYQKSFDGCNVIVNDISHVDQIWIKKYSDVALLKEKKVEIITEYKITCEIGINENSYKDFLYDINVDDILFSTEENDAEYRITDISGLNKSDSYIILECESGAFQPNSSGFDGIGSGKTLTINEENYTIFSIDSSTCENVSNNPGMKYYSNIKIRIKGNSLPELKPVNNDICYYHNTLDELPKTMFYLKNYNIYYTITGSFTAETYSAKNTSSQNYKFKKETTGKPFDATLESSSSIIHKQTEQTDPYGSIGLSVIHNLNPITNCWDSNIFTVFTGIDDYTTIDGIEAGYEKNVFFASRGISFKNKKIQNNYIEITDWKNTLIDKNKKTITLDITESLYNVIMYESDYISNWDNVSTNGISYKRKYIENNILPYIIINETCVFEMYASPSKTISMGTLSVAEENQLKKVENIKNTLFTENNKYYMKIERLQSNIYFAKMKIML